MAPCCTSDSPPRDILLWADALCINQKDVPGRNQQVRMMGDIYAAARSAVIWLGEEPGEVEMSFWLV
ncbi:hypothetical protein LY76DRAFT_657086, partial [Colletotrichum caudatum]